AELLGRLVDAEGVAPRVGELEAPAAGIPGQLDHDPTARSQHARQRVVGIVRTRERQDASTAGRRRHRVQPAELTVGIRRVLDPRVLAAVVVERPAERLRVEGLRRLEVVNGEFHVIDHGSHARRVTRPAASDESRGIRRSYCRTRYRGGLPVRSVTYSMNASLDGYIVGPDGGFNWSAPDAEVFRFWIDEIREVGVHLLGRRLYETMLYWETAEQDPSLGDAELEWAGLWNPLPKVVFTNTLSALQGNARLASGGLAEEIERLRAEPGDGDIAIGGATLAAEAAALDLIDEYRVVVYPVLVGGGISYFPQRERRVDLELVETRTFSSRFVYLRYRVVRQPLWAPGDSPEE